MIRDNNNRHTATRERPILHRPPLGVRHRIGVPMYWDPDPPSGGGAPAPPPEPPAPQPAPETAARLSKLERENERLTKALADRQAAEDKAKAEAERAEHEAAAKRGEWERLVGEEQAKGRTLAEQLDGERKARAELEAFLSERTEQALKGVEDDVVRKAWKAALEGQPPLQAQKTLDALMATMGASSTSTPAPSPRPGQPGRSRVIADRQLFAAPTAAGEKARQDAVLALMAKRGKG